MLSSPTRRSSSGSAARKSSRKSTSRGNWSTWWCDEKNSVCTPSSASDGRLLRDRAVDQPSKESLRHGRLSPRRRPRADGRGDGPVRQGDGGKEGTAHRRGAEEGEGRVQQVEVEERAG